MYSLNDPRDQSDGTDNPFISPEWEVLSVLSLKSLVWDEHVVRSDIGEKNDHLAEVLGYLSSQDFKLIGGYIIGHAYGVLQSLHQRLQPNESDDLSRLLRKLCEIPQETGKDN